jgi:hypothetical protein
MYSLNADRKGELFNPESVVTSAETAGTGVSGGGVAVWTSGLLTYDELLTENPGVFRDRYAREIALFGMYIHTTAHNLFDTITAMPLHSSCDAHTLYRDCSIIRMLANSARSVVLPYCSLSLTHRTLCCYAYMVQT